MQFNGREVIVNADNLEDIYKEVEKIQPLNSVEKNKVSIRFSGKTKTGKRLQGRGKFLQDGFHIIEMERLG